MGDKIFGKICLIKIVISFAPSVLTASIYSNFLTSIVEPRTIRANIGIEKKPTAIVTLIRLGPSALTIAKASKIPGKASMISKIRLIIESTHLP
ncbi:hypothetical protein D9M71_714860 [compost metagenome]